MKNRLLLTLPVIAVLTFTGCKPPVKTFSMKADFLVQPTADARTVNDVAAVMKKRLLKYGLKDKEITSSISGNTIHMVLTRVEDTVRVKRLLTTPGRLEFRETYENSEVQKYLAEADKYLMTHPDAVIHDQNQKDESETTGLADKIKEESLKPDSLLTVEEWAARHPLYGRLRPDVGSDGVPVPGSTLGFALKKDTAAVNTYLKMKEIRALMPADLRFAWSKSPARYFVSDTLYELHAIRLSTIDGKPVIDGNAVSSAVSVSDKKHPLPVIQINMNSEGADVWRRLTHDNTGRSIAIVMDGYVVSSPRIIDEIKGGNSEISAGFTADEASDLANIISSGSLPATVAVKTISIQD